MTLEEMVHEATEYGSGIGQISLAEFILKAYADDISPKLQTFLQKVCDNGYTGISKTVGKPAEDVALEVGKSLEKVG